MVLFQKGDMGPPQAGAPDSHIPTNGYNISASLTEIESKGKNKERRRGTFVWLTVLKLIKLELFHRTMISQDRARSGAGKGVGKDSTGEASA